ncbi:protein MFI isoform X3 [Alligator mississippiensis]|nr:protein MFI isoform X3 [Alligator mississippiensis]
MDKEDNAIDLYNNANLEKQNEAARIIQRSWKRYIDTRIFQYYKGLISFKMVGEPRLLMKYIDPLEADFLDAAAGAYIRFRLGGTSYPPNIYYKIFTHRPVVDMCANSPKDYSKLASKQSLTKKIHGKIWKDDGSGYYKRVENNGWRLLSAKAWKSMDPFTTEDNKKEIQFHFSKLKRKQDVEMRRKRKKIEWLKKIYMRQWKEIATSNTSDNYRGLRNKDSALTGLKPTSLDATTPSLSPLFWYTSSPDNMTQ